MEGKFQSMPNNGIWINKPSNMNCGRGIRLISDIKQFKAEYFAIKKSGLLNPSSLKLQKQTSNFRRSSLINPRKSVSIEKDAKPRERRNSIEHDNSNKFIKISIIQRYLENPLLLEGKKFDIRCYLLIASTKPMLAYFHHGYLRLSMHDYNLENIDEPEGRYTHLTNASVQKKHPSFQAEKEKTIWDMNKFESYATEKYSKTPEDFKILYDQIKRILAYVLKCGEKKLIKRKGMFDLMGIDILLDENFKPYLLEMNMNPAIFTDTTTQTNIIPKVIHTALDLILDLQCPTKNLEQMCQNEDKLPKGEFQLIRNEATNFSFE